MARQRRVGTCTFLRNAVRALRGSNACPGARLRDDHSERALRRLICPSSAYAARTFEGSEDTHVIAAAPQYTLANTCKSMVRSLR